MALTNRDGYLRSALEDGSVPEFSTLKALLITAVILGGYVWSLARRVDRAQKASSDRTGAE